jgi:predicted NUDIX family phosphoesterase
MNQKEQVLVFNAHLLEPYLPHFTSPLVTDPTLVAELTRELTKGWQTYFTDRGPAETNLAMKQVIPYCVLEQPFVEGPSYFVYQRTPKSGDSRLHDRWSVGVGGHINYCDEMAANPETNGEIYTVALARELKEEVGLELLPSELPSPVGFLYDPSDAIGQVHFGIVHVIHLRPTAHIRTTDPALAGGFFAMPEVLADKAAHFESWSRHLITGLLAPQG